MDAILKKAREELSKSLAAAQKAKATTEAALLKAKKDFDTAYAAVETLQTQASKFAEVFPDAETGKKKAGRKAKKKAGKKKAGRKAKASATPAPTTKGRKPKEGGSMASKMMKVMGRKAHRAKEVADLLIAEGLSTSDGKKLKAHVATTFSAAKDVHGPLFLPALNGGEIVRGQYRVAKFLTDVVRAETLNAMKGRSRRGPKKGKSGKKNGAAKQQEAPAEPEESTTKAAPIETNESPDTPTESPAETMLAESGLNMADLSSQLS